MISVGIYSDVFPNIYKLSKILPHISLYYITLPTISSITGHYWYILDISEHSEIFQLEQYFELFRDFIFISIQKYFYMFSHIPIILKYNWYTRYSSILQNTLICCAIFWTFLWFSLEYISRHISKHTCIF